MKYIKDGKIATKQIELNGFTIVNPTHEQYLEAGYSEYIAPVIEKTIEDYRREKIDAIESYYNSDEINLVSVQGVDIYLDPDTRFKLAERLTAANAAGISTANITLNGNTFNLSVADAEAMLNAIVLQYAAAYDVKESKIKEVNALAEIADIEAYDVKSNYPNKLVL